MYSLEVENMKIKRIKYYYAGELYINRNKYTIINRNK